jgi:tetratricopeptide (TPR) repeat protein
MYLLSVYLAQEKLDEAKVTIKQALDIFITESGRDDVHYAGAVNLLGEIYFREGQYEKASALFEEAMKLTARDYGAETQG